MKKINEIQLIISSLLITTSFFMGYLFAEKKYNIENKQEEINEK